VGLRATPLLKGRGCLLPGLGVFVLVAMFSVWYMVYYQPTRDLANSYRKVTACIADLVEDISTGAFICGDTQLLLLHGEAESFGDRQIRHH